MAGAAVDLTLVDACGDELDLGTTIDATPEASDGRCFTAAAGIGADARAHRDLLARVLGGAGSAQLPHRVVALELRRPVLGAAHRRPGGALRPRRPGGGGMSALPVDMVDVSPAAPVGPVLRVDTAAVSANVRLLAGRTSAEVMAVVKADGFGHGAVEVARAAMAGGATSLGVTSLAEALPLRAAGLDAPLLSWLNPVDADFATAVHADVELAVPPRWSTWPAITAHRPPGARVHLHLDTGLARDGAAPQEWAALCRAARAAERTGRLRGGRG